MQMQITLRFHFTPVRKATIQKTNNHKYWWGWVGGSTYTLLIEI
jgi:hypothetical protein